MQGLPGYNLKNNIFNFEGNYLNENELTKKICFNKLQKIETIIENETMNHQFARTKIEFYVQVKNLMISYLIVIMVCLSFVGFVIYVLGAPREIMTDNEIEEHVELTAIQRLEAFEKPKEVSDFHVKAEDSNEALYEEIGPGTSFASMSASK